MSAQWRCPHCRGVSFKSEKLLGLASIRITLGKTSLFCPVCGRKVNIADLTDGKYDINDEGEMLNTERVMARPVASASYKYGDIVSRVKKAIADNLDASASTMQPETRLVKELEADEYELVSLLMRLEYEFGIEFADEDIDLRKQEELTVRALAECVAKMLSLSGQFREPRKDEKSL